jgi:hypothetical protein
MGLTLAACGGSDVPNSAYVPAQEQQLRDAELAGLPAPIEVLDTLPTEIVPEVEEEVAATTAPCLRQIIRAFRMSRISGRSVIANLLKAMQSALRETARFTP